MHPLIENNIDSPYMAALRREERLATVAICLWSLLLGVVGYLVLG